jgi:glycosyltransferase involved in cell wall biosynthesis
MPYSYENKEENKRSIENMKNILLVCSEPTPTYVYYSQSILSTLKYQDFNFYFLYAFETKYIENLIGREKQIYIPFPKNKCLRFIFRLFHIKMLLKILKLHKQHNFSLIHLLAPDYSLANILPFIKNKIPIIYTVHNLHPPLKHKEMNFMVRFIVNGVKKNIKNSYGLCTSSMEQFLEMQKKFLDKKIFFHTMPSHISKIMIEGNKICDELNNANNYILFFGNIAKRKGIDVLCKAFSKLDENIKLVIAGNGENTFFDENIPNLIFINRYILDSEIRSLFENAKCVIYPYVWISQSAVLQFSYYFGIPVIASDLPYFKSQIIEGKTGLLFETGDSEDLIKKIKTILNGTIDLNKMKFAQKEQFESLFGEKRLAMELEEMYMRFLREKSISGDF